MKNSTREDLKQRKKTQGMGVEGGGGEKANIWQEKGTKKKREGVMGCALRGRLGKIKTRMKNMTNAKETKENK